MKKRNQIILFLSLLILSCNSDRNYKNFTFENYNLKVQIPKSFKTADSKQIKDFYILGHKTLEENGVEIKQIQNNILFLNKGEFSSIKIKYEKLNNNISKDYKNQWNNLKKTTFKVLQKEKLPESTIDSTSRIEKINKIEFYVFETNINLLDLNNKNANFKSLRYSTLLNDVDFVINVDYVNKIDEKELADIIESIIIIKK